MQKLFENWRKRLNEDLMSDVTLRQMLSDLSLGNISVEEAKEKAGNDPDAHRWIEQWEAEIARQELVRQELARQSPPEEELELDIEGGF